MAKPHAKLKHLRVPSQTQVEGPAELLSKEILLKIPGPANAWINANRFRVDIVDGAIEIYLAYQNRFQKKLDEVYIFTVPNHTFTHHFVNESKESFAESVKKVARAKLQPAVQLTDEEIGEAVKLVVLFANFGGLAISAESGGEIFFGTYSPWEISQMVPKVKIKSSPETAVGINLLVRCVMLIEDFGQLWDEMLNASEKMKVSK